MHDDAAAEATLTASEMDVNTKCKNNLRGWGLYTSASEKRGCREGSMRGRQKRRRHMKQKWEKRIQIRGRMR
jgi:hypothetical protein